MPRYFFGSARSLPLTNPPPHGSCLLGSWLLPPPHRTCSRFLTTTERRRTVTTSAAAADDACCSSGSCSFGMSLATLTLERLRRFLLGKGCLAFVSVDSSRGRLFCFEISARGTDILDTVRGPGVLLPSRR
jgi:hypothetical protein